MVSRVVSFLALALVCACSADRTEIVVAVDTNLVVPDQIDRIRIEVTGPEGSVPQSATAMLGDGQPELPRTLGLVHDDGPLGPYAVRAAGQLRGADIVERRASVRFVEGQTLLLRLDLVASCVGVTCEAGRTCTPSGCAPIEVDPQGLPEWTGTVDRLDASVPPADAGQGVDAGMPPADACVADEICNEADDDCDGMIDEGFDLQMDPNHCGACGNACAPPDRDCCSGVCGRC